MANTIDGGVLSSINRGGAGTGSAGVGEDLRENFMTLLVTQLKNQDPLNPMENAEMTSQLAQINTVTGIESLNDTLSGITGQIDAGHTLQAAGLIGKGVLVPGDRLLVGEEGATTPFGIELGSSADQVNVSILDGSGQVVRRFELGAMSAGVESFVWDGTLDGGSLAPKGAYRLSVEALADGKQQSFQTLNYAQVIAISTSYKDGPRLDLGGINEPVKMSDIRQIL
ncbi:flagellar hook assembly protein FlgD [Zobellella aerophila]|uniref:Basal-body rod modification protein FlgD n=1 Tax=Zobellella aerophila TaxID=870480 RepID=A0ABP6VRU6_9GAMM